MTNTLRPATKLTVVEEGTQFKGTLTSTCPIDVRGRVEGELHTPALTIGASGAVHGRVKVGEVHSQGEISGEFEAEKIQLSGVVKDNTVIRARSLDVKLHADRGKLEIVFGACELSVGDEPTETDHMPKPEATALAVVAPPVAPLMPEPLPLPAALEAAAPGAPEAAPAAAAAEEEDEADDTGAEAAEGEPGGKRKRKRKNGQEETATGWSQRPSQPPPA